jgi:hypothetical protein
MLVDFDDPGPIALQADHGGDRMLHRMLYVALVLLATVVPLYAVDGVREISQATVIAGGGFPYEITTSGSYRLTSNLLVVGGPSGGIVIKDGVGPVTLDLNGFILFGAASGGIGIEVESGSSRARVRNGTVGGFAVGIAAPGAMIIDDVVVTNNVVSGISLLGSSFGASALSRVYAADNGTGIRLRVGIVSDSVIAGNTVGINGEVESVQRAAFRDCLFQGNGTAVIGAIFTDGSESVQ